MMVVRSRAIHRAFGRRTAMNRAATVNCQLTAQPDMPVDALNLPRPASVSGNKTPTAAL